MDKRFWAINIHNYVYRNHAASKMFRDMEILISDLDELMSIKLLASQLQVALLQGHNVSGLCSKIIEMWDSDRKYHLDNKCLSQAWSRNCYDINR